VDDHRFDSVARSLAEGANRRTVLKAMLGLGAGALTGAVVTANDADAARRGFPGPHLFPICTPQCDGTTCGDDGCGGSCSCASGCGNCLPEDLPDAPPGTPRICVVNFFWTPGEPCTDPAFACDPNSAWPTCEPVSGACILAC
jgi:hypothetical protein